MLNFLVYMEISFTFVGMNATLYNAVLIASGERLQVYLMEGENVYSSPKYPGVRFGADELQILGLA